MSARETFSPLKDREIKKSSIVEISRTSEVKPEVKPEIKSEVKPEIKVQIPFKEFESHFNKMEKSILDKINFNHVPSIDTSHYGMIEKSSHKGLAVLLFFIGLGVLVYLQKDFIMSKYLEFKFRNVKSD